MAARAVRKLTESGSPFTLEEAVDDYLALFVANQATRSPLSESRDPVLRRGVHLSGSTFPKSEFLL